MEIILAAWSAVGDLGGKSLSFHHYCRSHLILKGQHNGII
jgi:hypothetical protein